MKRHNMSKLEGGKSMQRTKRMMLGLVAVFVLGGSLALLGCSDDDDDNIIDIGDQGTAAALLGSRTFTFADGTAFGVTPANTPTTLAFNANATRFSVSTAARRATGTVTYGSCIFTVGPSTTNPDATGGIGGGTNFPANTGPQANQQFVADPCTFDEDATTLTITIGGTTATSTTTGSTGTGGFGG
jgi:hypothetical protein